MRSGISISLTESTEGKISGERKYQVDFPKGSRSMGTYHYLDGARIRIFYRGNEKTCGRCHEPARSCLGKGMAKDCDLAGGMRVILSDHMKKIWREIGFQPASFTLPTGDDANEENDIPISENSRFRRSDKLADQSGDIEDKFVGMTIANISLECTDEEVRKFIADNVSDDLDEEELDIVRDMRKTVVTITRMLNSQTIKNAMLKINFSDCKQKFFGRPLFCRPLRDITPEKINTVEKIISTEDKTSSTPTHDQQTGTISKIIPGLPSEEQQRDLSKKKKKERQRKLKEKMNKEDIEGKEKKQKQIQNL